MIQNGSDFPAGIDAGPAIEGKGDLISINGMAWNTLSSFGLPYNWNIRGMLSSGNTGNPGMPVVLGRIERAEGDEGIVPIMRTHAGATTAQSAGSLLGYNLYRDGQQVNGTLLTALSYNDLPGYTGIISYALTAVYDLGESLPATLSIQVNPPVNLPQGWDFTKTMFVHNIYIPAPTAMSSPGLQYGDMFGVFYCDGNTLRCAGAAMYTNGQLLLQAYGDDPATPQKEGFAEGETLLWKFHQHGATVSQNMSVTYNTSMPDHEGVFRNLGLSMLATMETGIVGTAENNALDLISHYPNPSAGMLNLTGLQPGMQLNVIDMTGRTVMSRNVRTATERLTIEASGLYVVEVVHQGKVWRRKIIVTR